MKVEPHTSAQPLRVLQVTPRVAPSVGGVETHVLEVSRRMADCGVDIHVLATDETGRLPRQDTLAGVPLVRLPAWPRGRDWHFAPEIGHRVAHGSWDLVHIQSYHTLVAPLAMVAAARARTPYVVTFHGGGTSRNHRDALRGVQVRLLGPLLRRAAALVAIAQFEIEYYGRLADLPPGRFTVIPNGADLPDLPAGEPPSRPGTLIVSSGRLERYKGHHKVIDAMPTVLREVPDAHLWIAGDGPEWGALRAQADELGISDRVEIGASDRGVLRARLATAALAVLLSDFESHPLAVLEAASLRVPVLVAANSGMSELASQGMARAVDAEAGPDVHAAAMLALLRAGPPSTAVALPTWDECAHDLMALYRRIAQRP